MMRNRSFHFAWLVLALVCLSSLAGAREELIQKESDWSFHPGGEDLGGNWTSVAYDASNWKTGTGVFGYGDSGVTTEVISEQDPPPVTAYFRKSFELEAIGDWQRLDAELRMDDGAIVHLNGRPLYRANMPAGAILPNTLASGNASFQGQYRRFELPAWALKLLTPGKNVLAVEVHQYRVGSSDMVFDFALTAIEKGVVEKVVFDERSEWKYRDARQPPADAWKSRTFDDGAWKVGKGILGYGDDDVATKLDFGDDPDNKPVTVWFRKTFEIDEALTPDVLRLKFLRDDGAIIYLNGRELMRNNLPSGFLEPRTLAVSSVNNWAERYRREFTLGASGLVAGNNVIAVEVHQKKPDSSDLAFDMSLEVSFLPPGKGRSDQTVAVRKPERINVADLKAIANARPADWRLTSEQILASAMRAYAVGNLQDAARRYYASRWTAVYATRGAALDAALKQFLIQDAQASNSQEFFDLLSQFDNHARVYETLLKLFKESAANFSKHPKLALAIALVYDQRPPRNWPHHQVSASILPRKLPDPVEALNFWSDTEARGKTLHALNSLTIEELKYVVDTPASFDELKAAQKERVKLNDVESLYSGIDYVMGRAQGGIYNWPHERYKLADIKLHGGICVDQAYYATQMAKARGVPSMVVSGAGQNGNHAWIGFLDRRGRWNFEVGRYPESKFVTGVTHDPQTWQMPTDHELAFLSERFRNTSKYRASRIHALFAQEYLERRKLAEAIAASESAISAESRNLEAWESLIAAKEAGKAKPSDLDAIYERGAKAFSRYADLEASFLRRLSASLDAQGRTEEAEKLRARIISRNRRDRPDLALEEAKADIEEAIKEAPPKTQLALYKRQLNRFKDAGLIAYYAITQPFLTHHAEKGDREIAREALKYTEKRMESKEDGQLMEALTKWSERLGK